MKSPYWLLIVLLLPLQGFAQSMGKITFTEGRVRVIREASLILGAQGLALESTDILETAKPGFALVELSDGTVLAMGDATRIMLSRVPQATGAEILMLEGWLKLQARQADAENAYSVSSLVQSVSVKNASLIMRAGASDGEVFIESGSATVGQTDKRGRPAGLLPGKAGQFFTQSANKPAVTQARPGEAFLSAMPPAFKDALPARLERFKDRKVEASVAGPVSYADVGDWLSAAPSWRSSFIKRFEPRLADPQFRQQLNAQLKRHPEWDKILHPPVKQQ